jgi:hypothetical protein
MILMLKSRARLATEALAQLVVAYVKESVSRVFLFEGKGRVGSVMVMLLLRPMGSALALEHLIKGLQRIEAAELEAQVLGAPRNVVTDIGVGWHQVLLMVQVL